MYLFIIRLVKDITYTYTHIFIYTCFNNSSKQNAYKLDKHTNYNSLCVCERVRAYTMTSILIDGENQNEADEMAIDNSKVDLLKSNASFIYFLFNTSLEYGKI